MVITFHDHFVQSLRSVSFRLFLPIPHLNTHTLTLTLSPFPCFTFNFSTFPVFCVSGTSGLSFFTFFLSKLLVRRQVSQLLGVAAAATAGCSFLAARDQPSFLEPDKRARSSVEFKIRPGNGQSMGVGVAVFVLHPKKYPGCVLLGKRIGSDGSGTYALPGGHVAFGESLAETAVRETKEETGLNVSDVQCAGSTPSSPLLIAYSVIPTLTGCRHPNLGLCNAIESDAGYHYLVPIMVCHVDAEADDEGEPINLEPEKNEGWRWVKWKAKTEAEFPSPLFSALRKVREAGFDPTAIPLGTVIYDHEVAAHLTT
jgi:8-oxo-dGTP diphosphatase